MPWVPLVGPEQDDSPTLRATGYDLLRPSLGQSLGAAAGEEMADYSGTGAALRLNRMDDALARPEVLNTPGGLIEVEPVDLGRRPVTPLDEAAWKASPDYRKGLSYFDGMTKEAAQILAQRADARQSRSDILARDAGGLGRNAAIFTARLLAQAADPVGLALGFLPVVGEARYAAWLARMGRTPARLAAGGVEGAVGSAALEPLILGAAQADQLDYDLVDSLVNVGMGGVFGAGLRAGGGAIVDLIRRRGVETHSAAMDLAITQAAADQPVDVRAVMARAPADEAMPAAEAAPIRADIAQAVDQVRAAEIQAVRRAREQIAQQRQRDAMRTRPLAERRAEAERFLEEAFPSHKIKLPSGKEVTRKGPMDIVTFLRSIGGVRDEGGELRADDIRNTAQGRGRTRFAGGEQFLGPLVSERGLPLEDAARRAAEAGYIGRRDIDVAEDGTPLPTTVQTTEELVEAIRRTVEARDDIGGRVWSADDADVLREYRAFEDQADDDLAMAPPVADEDDWMALDDDARRFEDEDAERYFNPESLAQDAEMEWRAERGMGAADDAAEVAEPELDLESGFQAAAACIARARS